MHINSVCQWQSDQPKQSRVVITNIFHWCTKIYLKYTTSIYYINTIIIQPQQYYPFVLYDHSFYSYLIIIIMTILWWCIIIIILIWRWTSYVMWWVCACERLCLCLLLLLMILLLLLWKFMNKWWHARIGKRIIIDAILSV